MGAEEKSLKIYDTRTTFFGKLGNTISKLLTPTQAGINNMLVSIKRSTMIKAYKNMKKSAKGKEEILEKRFKESYLLYLDSIDQLIVDTIYKKVRTDKASDFEKDALSKYYNVIHLKENDEAEYKLKKQEYLLRLDFASLNNTNKTKLLEEYKAIYIYEMEKIHKALLKHYSMKLTEKLTPAEKEEAYEKIFETLESYVTNIISMKEITDEEIVKQCSLFETYEVGKLDQIDILDKKMILLGISRKLFVHSLPLVVAERCYIKLLKDTRALIVDTKIARKRENAYQLLLRLIEQYNDKLLSVKIYWDKPESKTEYQKFSEKRKALNEIKEKQGNHEYEVKKQILYIRSDIKLLENYGNKYFRILQFYRRRLVNLGDMKQLKNKCKTTEKAMKGQVRGKVLVNEKAS